MTRWFLRRSADALFTIALAIVALVTLVHLLPGDPLVALLQERSVDPVQRAAMEALWGTNRSVPEAIGATLSGIARGDLGLSFATQRPVGTILLERIGPTLLLGALTLLCSFAIGLCVGLWQALHPTSRRARVISGLSLVGYTLPSFVIGMLLIWLFAIALPWFPPGGLVDPLLAEDVTRGTIFLDQLRHLALPLLTMVIATVAVPLRQQRAAALATATQPWVLAARARAVSPSRIAWQHVWRPALTPIITLFGLWLPLLVSGAVFVEALFNWPGLGSLIATSTTERDIPVVVGAGILLVIMVQVGSLAADVLYRIANPAQQDG